MNRSRLEAYFGYHLKNEALRDEFETKAVFMLEGSYEHCDGDKKCKNRCSDRISVFCAAFDFDGLGFRSFVEIGKANKMGPLKTRMMFETAIRMLKHPSRFKHLKPLLEKITFEQNMT